MGFSDGLGCILLQAPLTFLDGRQTVQAYAQTLEDNLLLLAELSGG